MTGREELERRVLEALGWPCDFCRRIVVLLLSHIYDKSPVGLVATELGLKARWRVSRQLMRHGLPGPRHLKDWLLVLTVTWEWDRERRSLVAQAFAGRAEPSVLRRAIQRRTGTRWSVVRARGFDFWLGAFTRELGASIRCGAREASGVTDSAPHRNASS